MITLKDFPPNTYFPVERAAELLSLRVSDLLYMAAEGQICLGVLLDNAIAINIRKESKPPKSPFMDTGISRFSIDGFSALAKYDDEYKRFTSFGVAAGLWHLHPEQIEGIVHKGECVLGSGLTAAHADAGSDVDPECGYLIMGAWRDNLPMGMMMQLGCTQESIEQQPDIRVSASHLFISRAWVKAIASYTSSGAAMPAHRIERKMTETPPSKRTGRHEVALLLEAFHSLGLTEDEMRKGSAEELLRKISKHNADLGQMDGKTLFAYLRRAGARD